MTRPIVHAALVLGAALALTAPARAQVAVAAAIDGADVSQRSLASLVVGRASEQWSMLDPQLMPSATADCEATDSRCLREVARKRGASHVLLVGVAPVGTRDHVVVVQLFATSDETALYEGSVRQRGSQNTPEEVERLARELVQTRGPAPRVAEPSAIAPSSSPMSALQVAGATTLAVSALALGGTLAGFALVANRQPQEASVLAVVGAAGTAGCAAVGSAMLLIAALSNNS